MKKEMFMMLGVLLTVLLATSLVLAAQGENNPNNQNNSGNQVQINQSNQGLGQTIRNQVRAGVYTNEQGDQIRISQMAQNRLRIEVGGIEAECGCELEEERVNNRTRLKTKLSNGRNAEIKIMPDTASETALNRLRLKVCSEENGCQIELKEVGKGNQTRLAYEVQAERHFRILGMFKTKAQVKAQVDAENGEIIQTKKPWWAFLATEPEE